LQLAGINLSFSFCTDEGRSTLLRRLCLVSKSFLSFARPELYRVVSLDFEDHLNEYPDYALGYESPDESEDEDEDPPFRSERLVKALEESPHLRPLIRTLNTKFEVYEDDRRAMRAQKILLDIFRLCRKVTRFEHEGRGAGEL